MTLVRQAGAGVVALGLGVAALTACGSDGAEEEPGPPRPIASYDDLRGTTTVSLDAGLLDVLAGSRVRVSAYGTADLDDATLELPVTGGHATLFERDAGPAPVVGQVQHEGSGLVLTGPTSTVAVGNANLDPYAGVVYGDVVVGDRVEASSVALLTFDGTGEAPTFEGGEAVLDDYALTLTDRFATLLDRALGTDALTDRTVLGRARVAVATT